MKDTNFFLGIFAIMALYYLFTRGLVIEGAENLGDSRIMDDIKQLPDIQRMQMINQEIARSTKEMAQKQVFRQRSVPLFPVPKKETIAKEKISKYLQNINDYMKELAVESDSQFDKDEDIYTSEQVHSRGEPTYTRPAFHVQGTVATHPEWYVDPDGNPHNPTNNKNSATRTFSQLNTSAQGNIPEFTAKDIYQRRPYNRITPVELKKWFGSTANVKTFDPTNINKNLVVKYKK